MTISLQKSALFKLSNIDRRSTSSSRLATSISAIAIPMNIINQYLSGPLALCYGAITDSSSGVLGPLAISAGSSPSGNALQAVFLPPLSIALPSFSSSSRILNVQRIDRNWSDRSRLISLFPFLVSGHWQKACKLNFSPLPPLRLGNTSGYISVVTMPVQAIFQIEQDKVCASAVVQGRQVRAGSKGKRIGRGQAFKSLSSNSIYKRKMMMMHEPLFLKVK